MRVQHTHATDCTDVELASECAMLQVILSCVYGTTTTARLKQQGMEFAVWVFKHADDAQLQPHSNVILQNLLRLLNEGDTLQL